MCSCDLMCTGLRLHTDQPLAYACRVLRPHSHCKLLTGRHAYIMCKYCWSVWSSGPSLDVCIFSLRLFWGMKVLFTSRQKRIWPSRLSILTWLLVSNTISCSIYSCFYFILLLLQYTCIFSFSLFMFGVLVFTLLFMNGVPVNACKLNLMIQFFIGT